MQRHNKRHSSEKADRMRNHSKCPSSFWYAAVSRKTLHVTDPSATWHSKAQFVFEGCRAVRPPRFLSCSSAVTDCKKARFFFWAPLRALPKQYGQGWR